MLLGFFGESPTDLFLLRLTTAAVGRALLVEAALPVLLSLLDQLGELGSNLHVALVLLALEVHLESVFCVSHALQRATHFADFHVAVGLLFLIFCRFVAFIEHFFFVAILDIALAHQLIFQLFLLRANIFDLKHDSLGLVNVAFFTLLLS